MAEIPIRCSVASAVVLEDEADQPRMLLLRRSKQHLFGEWCHVSGGTEDGETAWQTALREIREESGLPVVRLYSADYNEQFYEAGQNTFTVVPVFVAYVDSSRAVRLNAEHSEFRWVTIHEAQSLVTFGGQRRVYEEIQREFVERRPSPWHEIVIASTYIPPYPNTTRDVLLVAAACVGAFELFQWLFAQWAMLRIWEPWIRYPVLGTYGPFLTIAILTGFVVGACVAALARAKSKLNLTWSAAFACVLSFGAAVVAGGIAWAASEPTVLLGPSIGLGLIVGGVVVRKAVHA